LSSKNLLTSQKSIIKNTQSRLLPYKSHKDF